MKVYATRIIDVLNILKENSLTFYYLIRPDNLNTSSVIAFDIKNDVC